MLVYVFIDLYHIQMRSSMVEREKERQREALEKQQKAAAALNKSVNIQAFRSFNLKGKDHQMKQFWSKRLFEVSWSCYNGSRNGCCSRTVVLMCYVSNNV
jgi:7-cyano-7-deazaguanine synthase in queuosine biosynthesis